MFELDYPEVILILGVVVTVTAFLALVIVQNRLDARSRREFDKKMLELQAAKYEADMQFALQQKETQTSDDWIGLVKQLLANPNAVRELAPVAKELIEAAGSAFNAAGKVGKP